MDRLTGVAELLDGPLDDPAALVANLRDLARLNRVSGGIGLSQRAIEALLAEESAALLAGEPAARRPATILDVGTGGADIPIALLARAAREGRSQCITATDSRAEVLAAARTLRPTIDRIAGLTLEIADGRGLPYPDGAFDVAHASLVLHHLEPADATAFLRELRRVARRGIVVNDLARSRLGWLGVWLVTHTLASSCYTRHDGPLSVRRAYTRPEMEWLVRQAGLKVLATSAGVGGHRYAIVAV